MQPNTNPQAQAEDLTRGMPHWRVKQRNLPISEKIELLGRFILETREFEAIKKSCKPSATFSNDSSKKG
jgi:hypothetical protein